MKKFLLVLFFIPFFSSAQNWSLFNSAEKFNYRLDGDNVITTTILVDSVQLNGNDSVFFLNRIMCDTCATIIGGPNACDTCYSMINRPQFLQREVHLSAPGIFNLRDTGNIVINSIAAVNDSWLFDSVYNINATVTVITLDSVFGIADSIKTILLSTGDTVRLSQNFGLIQYPRSYGLNSYYRLTGIEGRNNGEQAPKFSDFFNLDIGDMFEYHGYGIYDGGCFYDSLFKYEIISKQILGDTMIYSFNGLVRDTTWAPFGGCSLTNYSGPFSGTLIYVDSGLHFSNFYNRQLMKISAGATGPAAILDSAYDHIRMYRDSNQVLTKSFGVTFRQVGWYPYYYYFYVPTAISDIYNTYPSGTMPSCGPSLTCKVGLGITDFGEGGCFEMEFERHLVAYRKGNDTVGVFTPDSVFLLPNGIQDEQQLKEDEVSFYPNPTTGKFAVHIPIAGGAPGTIELEVLNLLGEKRMTVLSPSNDDKKFEDVDISAMPAGVYIIELKCGQKIYHQTVVKE